MQTNSARTSSLEKPLPQNLEAERAILAGILMDNSLLSLAVKYLSSADFFLDQHKRIFRCMLAMHDKCAVMELTTVCETLQNDGNLEASGGASYIAELFSILNWCKPSTIEQYAQIVKKKAMLRRIANAGHDMSQLALEDGADLATLQAKFREVVTESAEPFKVIGGNGHLRYGLVEFLSTEFPSPEHLIEGIMPRGGSGLLIALPHRMKSWFTTALALGASKEGMILGGKLEVKKPVRTLLIQVEDFPGVLQWRMRELAMKIPCNAENVSVIPRCGLNLPDEKWYAQLLRETETFKADLVIMDVVRRIFRGDINSPQDTALFLEQIDRLREATDCAVLLVHHENKKDAEIMSAGAGSYNLPGWANVMIQFKRKTQEGHITHVEIEVDNKLAQSPEPMRMVLNLASEEPIRLEAVEDSTGIMEAKDQLGNEWTVRDLAEVLGVVKSNALRRLKKWMASNDVEKISGGKRGRMGGLARYRFVGAGE
jgi:hypothetical protein